MYMESEVPPTGRSRGPRPRRRCIEVGASPCSNSALRILCMCIYVMAICGNMYSCIIISILLIIMQCQRCFAGVLSPFPVAEDCLSLLAMF